ncbi:MAG TPA: hypothetical protein VKB80_27005 [Kofleriaceae bacterium]|nr:hypothetical protein [Kofleriaceae bacterium]
MCILCEFLQGLFPEVCVWDPTIGLPPERTQNVDAIGIVIQPGPHQIVEYIQLFMTNPEQVANLWGHTALYLRRGGQIVRVIGFDPHRIMMVRDVVPRLLGGWGGTVSGGRRGTTGVYYDEERMFRSPDLIAVEFPLGVGQLYHIEEVLDVLPPTGTAGPLTHQGFLQEYVTKDGLSFPGHFNPDVMGNCLNSIMQILARSNLVISPTGTRLSSQGRYIARPGHDVSPFQTATTEVAETGPVLALHDLDQSPPNHVLASFSGYMSTAMAAGRRLGTSIVTLAATSASVHFVVRALAGTRIEALAATAMNWFGLGGVSAPSGAWWQYAAILKVLLSVLVEGLPRDSVFWRLRPELLERLLTGIVKACFVYALARGDMSAWVPAIWVMTSLLMAALRR